jgi:hypothetical protein
MRGLAGWRTARVNEAERIVRERMSACFVRVRESDGDYKVLVHLITYLVCEQEI